MAMSLISSFKTFGKCYFGRDYQKVIVLLLLVLIGAGLIYYSHWVLRTDIVFSHFLYIPIVLSGFWWGTRGIWIAVFLGIFLMVFHLLSGLDVPFVSEVLRAMMFLAVGMMVGFLRELALRSENNLRETRNYLDNLIRYANAPIIVWDKEGKITLFNAAFERLTGYRADEVMDKPLTMIFNGVNKKKSLEKVEQTLSGQHWETIEIPTRCKDGEERILLWNSATIYAEDGKTLMATIAQGQDITVRKQAEDALNLRVNELATHENIVNSMLCTLDLDERLEIGIKEIMKLTGAEKAGISLVEGDRLIMQKQFGFSKDYLAWAGDLDIEDYPSCEEITIGGNDIPDPAFRLETAFKKETVKSWVTVPFKSGRGLLGILILASGRPQAFAGKNINILSTLSSSLALMLEQADLYRTARERLARLTTLREIDIAISANLSMEGIIDVVLQKVSPHILVDAVGISLIDWDQRQTILARLHMPDGVNIEGEAFTLSDNLIAQLGVEKRPVIIYDIKSDPRLQNHKDIARKYNLCSYVGVPLVVHHTAIGVLHMFTVEPHEFSQEDLDFFATLAGQAAISVQNARLYDEAKRRAVNMEGLAKAIINFSQTSVEEKLAKQTMASALNISGAETGALFWYSKDTNALDLTYGIGIPEDAISGMKEMHPSPVVPGAGLVGLVAFRGQPVYVPDVLKNPLWEMKSLGPGSAYLVPLVFRKHIFGVYAFLSQRTDSFSQEQFSMADTFVSYISSALENIRLFRETQRAHEELQKTQRQLLQIQKMESIGTLAGGIAHDFNNLLAAILGFTELSLLDIPAESKAHEDMSQVLTAGKRAKALVSQILAFSRQANGKPKPIQIAPIAKEAIKLLRATLPSTIEIRQNISQHTGTVNADTTQIHQCLMNLCTNALQAMDDRGVLEISLINVELDEKFCAGIEDLTAGSYVRLTVRDTGRGMDKKTLKRIFDPFFTTKKPGKGTGMGLSVVHGIIKSHEGHITVQSEPGVGTTFQIYLPALESIAKVRDEIERPVQGGTESILFVDDEAMVAEMGMQTLTRLGYSVTTRTSSIEALELFRVKPDEFDIVITDQTMPNMTGADLSVEILRIRPDIPIILCTGFSHTISLEKARALGIHEFVMKPVVGAELGQTVRQVLDKTPRAEVGGRRTNRLTGQPARGLRLK